MLSPLLYLFLFITAAFFLYLPYGAYVDLAINIRKDKSDLGAIRKKVIIRIALAVLLCAAIMGLVFGYL